MRTVTIVIDKNGVAIVELEEFQGKGIRDRTAYSLVVNVERAIMHSNSQLTDCFVSLALRRAAHDCITGDGSSGAALRLC